MSGYIRYMHDVSIISWKLVNVNWGSNGLLWTSEQNISFTSEEISLFFSQYRGAIRKVNLDAVLVKDLEIPARRRDIYYINKRMLKEVERSHHVRWESLEIPTII